MLNKEILISSLSTICDDVILKKIIGSTNTHLIQKIQSGAAKNCLCIANEQTEGRGQRGKSWYSSSKDNLYLSYSKKIDVQNLSDISAVPLVVALSLLESFSDKLNEKLFIKWPNDIYLKNKKVGGILVENINYLNTNYLVIGLGLNFVLTDEERELLGNSADCLSQVLIKDSFEINSWLISLISFLDFNIDRYLKLGFAEFVSFWEKHDYLSGKRIKLVDGLVLDVLRVDLDGALKARNVESGDLINLSCGALSSSFKVVF